MIQDIIQNNLSQSIGEIHECALDSGCWRTPLERMGRALGACNGTVLNYVMYDASFECFPGAPPESLVRSATIYCWIRPLLRIAWHFDVDDPISVEWLMTEDDPRNTRFHRKPPPLQRCFDFPAVALEKVATNASAISFARFRGAGPPLPDDVALLCRVVSHCFRLRIVFGIRQRDVARANDFGLTLDMMQVPASTCGHDRLRVDWDSAARRFLAQSDTIRFRDRGIGVALKPAFSKSSRMISAMAATVDGVQPMLFTVAQQGGRHCAPHDIPSSHALRNRIGAAPRSATAWLIQPVDGVQPVPVAVVVHLHGLITAGIRLLILLGQGLSLENRAVTPSVGITTARTHLHRVSRRIITNRQSQLVRLVPTSLLEHHPGACTRSERDYLRSAGRPSPCTTEPAKYRSESGRRRAIQRMRLSRERAIQRSSGCKLLRHRGMEDLFLVLGGSLRHRLTLQ